MTTEPPPGARWQALLVGVASNAYSWEWSFAQALNSQAELARALERNMPGLSDDNLILLPEPRYAHEVTDAIAKLNEAHDDDHRAGLPRPGLLFYYCGHGTDVDGHLYLSMTETIHEHPDVRRTGLAVSSVLETSATTRLFKRRRRVVLILDCCKAGLACEESAAERAHLLMAVGPEGEAEHHPDSTGPTHFTGALVELLRDGDPGAGPWIDLGTAYRWLEPRLVMRHGKELRPYLHPAGGGDAIVLGRNSAYRGPR